MSTDKPFRKISDLMAALSAAEKGLTAGTLGLEGLEIACEDTRELFERLVVLRHKARESAIGHAPVVEEHRQATPPAPKVEDVKAVVATAVAEPRPLRLDTRPAVEISPRQTSLIEAIASTEMEAPATPSKVPGQPKPVDVKSIPQPTPSLAEKLEKAALADLGRAISLSHKFWFVAELFNGDRITYEKSIEKLNGFANLAEAQAFVHSEVIAKLKKPADPEALATFTDLVQRRYA